MNVKKNFCKSSFLLDMYAEVNKFYHYSLY